MIVISSAIWRISAILWEIYIIPHPRSRSSYPKLGGVMINEKKMYDDTMEVFKELEIDVDPRRIMSTMPVSQRQMVEIAKAVCHAA